MIECFVERQQFFLEKITLTGNLEILLPVKNIWFYTKYMNFPWDWLGKSVVSETFLVEINLGVIFPAHFPCVVKKEETLEISTNIHQQLQKSINTFFTFNAFMWSCSRLRYIKRCNHVHALCLRENSWTIWREATHKKLLRTGRKTKENFLRVKILFLFLQQKHQETFSCSGKRSLFSGKVYSKRKFILSAQQTHRQAKWFWNKSNVACAVLTAHIKNLNDNSSSAMDKWTNKNNCLRFFTTFFTHLRVSIL